MEWILIADLNRLGRVSSFIWTHLHLVCVRVFMCLCVYVCMQAWGKARVCYNYNFTLFRHLEKRAKQSPVISVCVCVRVCVHACTVCYIRSANAVRVFVHTCLNVCAVPCVCVCARAREGETVCICSRILTLQKWHVFSIYPILSPHIRCLQKTEH